MRAFSPTGLPFPLTKLCAWFGVPRRTVYYRPTKAPPKIDPAFVVPIKALIETKPSFGYRTVAWLLGFKKNTVQRIFPAEGLAGSQAPRRRAPAHRGDAVGGPGSERAMVH